jgi:hypothetical protein
VFTVVAGVGFHMAGTFSSRHPTWCRPGGDGELSGRRFDRRWKSRGRVVGGIAGAGRGCDRQTSCSRLVRQHRNALGKGLCRDSSGYPAEQPPRRPRRGTKSKVSPRRGGSTKVQAAWPNMSRVEWAKIRLLKIRGKIETTSRTT